ncbi:putative ribonuclease H-like domain-containing protein, partial [Tanacetum coccineum]
DYPHRALQNKGIVNSGCSRHMTGNKAYLVEYQEFNGGPVAFGGSKGYITGKGQIKTGKLDFEDVCFVKELQHFNLFYVSQICDKKNKVLFTDSECLVLSPEFKLPDANQVLLRIPRQNNMYSFNLENIVPSRGLACLIANATIDESNKWHRRLGYVSFKNLNKLVKGNLVRGKGPTWLFDLDYLIDSMNYQPVRSENQVNKHAGPKEANHNVGTEDNIDASDSEIEVESAQDYFVLPIWSSYTSTVKISKAMNAGVEPNKHPDLKTDEKPVDKEDQVFLDELGRLKRQEQDANDAAEALRKDTASPYGGLSFTDLTNTDQDDSEIPALEEIYNNPTDGIFTNASYDDEDPKLAVQTRSKVTKSFEAHGFEELLQFKIQKVWILVDLPYGKKAIRTKWVYRNKKDERGVVVRNKARLVAQRHRQEEGIDSDEVFAPVARIEAIRIFLAFASYMGFIVYQMDVKSAFLYGKIDEKVYVSQPPRFVDSKYPKKVYKVVKALYGLHQAPRVWYATLSTFLLKNRYRRGTIDKTLFIKKDKNNIMLMSSMGELTFFLGLQVKQKEDGIFISQDKYVAEILKKFDFVSVKTASTPIKTQKALVNDEEASDVDVHLYRSMIGSLMYLTASRPDIMFAVCACSRFQVTPKTSHLNAVKRIFRYLKGKPKLGLWYPRVSSFDLEAYSDSDYAGANLDRKSTTGGCQFLGRRLISWQCKKQTIVATSTTEAEYVAAANCCGHHFIRDAYEKKLIQVLKIHTDDNVADLLTKAFDVSRRIIAQQRSEAIRNKPPTKNQFRNQMMTYLKHVGNKKHADLKTKSFDKIKALYEKVKRFDDSFITIGFTEDERKIKEMNEGASDPDKKKKIVKEDVSAKVPAKQDVVEQGTIDSEIMEIKSFISKLDKVSSPEGDYLVVYRVNGNFRAFNYLMEVLHIFDRQDLFHLYDLVMKEYSESTPEGIELILWGDLKIMMESSIEVTDQGDFWNDQQDWEIVTWRLYEACGVCILEFKDGTVIHMLVERKYPLSKELLQRMLDFGLEVEVESTAALDLIRVLNSPCFMVKSWLVQDQTVLGKDYSNLLIADSLLKTIWFINAPCYGNEALASPKANGLTIPEQTATDVAVLLKTCCRRIAKDVKETLRSDQDLSECLNTSSMKFKESTPKKHEVKQVQQSCLGEDCWELYIPDLVPNSMAGSEDDIPPPSPPNKIQVNESGSESNQDENEEDIGDDEEGVKNESVKTPSNDSDDEDETKITDKVEGDEDEEMDYTTS